MDTSILFTNFTNPPVLFFFLGVFAVFVKSNLEIPPPLPKLFSLYLLFSIGFKGGAELNHSTFDNELLLSLLGALILSTCVPVYTFFLLKQRLDVVNSGAIAATYGSISAVTFIAATSFLTSLGIPYGGYMVAAMSLMESPAIIIAVILVRLYSGEKHASLRVLIREALVDGSVLLIMGSLVIGMTTSEAGIKSVMPFTDEIFRGMLCLFLLDMGMVAAQRLRELLNSGLFLTVFALAIPVFNAFFGMLVSYFLDLSFGNTFMMTILAASASYIAVPAAMRIALPNASPGLYVPMALALTFPFNILIGIPLYYQLIRYFGF